MSTYDFGQKKMGLRFLSNNLERLANKGLQPTSVALEAAALCPLRPRAARG
jgi:hypothetical protein